MDDGWIDGWMDGWMDRPRYLGRPSHLKIPGGSKMARAQLSRGHRRAMCGNVSANRSDDMFAVLLLGGPLIAGTELC